MSIDLLLNRASESDAISLPYNYVPTQYVAIIMLTLFGISTILHTGQAIYFRTWWALLTIVVAGLLEIMGWSARLWSSISPSLLSPYEMQLTCTILAPTPLVAGNFIILGYIINQLGPDYSRLPPRWYSIIFCSFDLISLVIQAIGGGKFPISIPFPKTDPRLQGAAASAVGVGKDPTPGGHIMLGGIAFQMATITIYVFCATEFFIRYFKDAPLRRNQKGSAKKGGGSEEKHEEGSIGITSTDTATIAMNGRPRDHYRAVMNTKLKIAVAALIFSTICLFIRAVYRTIELANGWTGRIISTQVYFNVLDGTMIILAIYTLNIAHPGLLLLQKTPSVDKRIGHVA
ncbi:RTA1 like protein [Gymnopus androsaceus JB14]|uniref:RTA1 like protein n=1 Tax=Gymnopus androsaceus JB14 TaxID=1447944 RepID=A0A6A4H8J4_9AGAR|nr:RTA1 like protein [Gymnopus androsaceus JB14]